MELECESIKEYLKSYNQGIELPDIKICLFEKVYPPKRDSFLIAEELVKIVKKDDKVLDIETGLGILAILAAKKGAFNVATDIHEGSAKCAKYNAFLNNVELDAFVGNLLELIKEGNLFKIIVSNMATLPAPPNEQHNECITRNVDACLDGRKYLELLINQKPKYLKEEGVFLTLHSNFANIEKTKNKLEDLWFKVELKVYEDPIGKTSGQRIDYFLMPLPENCHPIKKERSWYQKIGVFNARRE